MPLSKLSPQNPQREKGGGGGGGGGVGVDDPGVTKFIARSRFGL